MLVTLPAASLSRTGISSAIEYGLPLPFLPLHYYYYYYYYYPFNGLFSRTTWVSQYLKGKTRLDLNETIDDGVCGCSGISWTICKQSAPHCRQITTPTPHHSIFYRPDALPDAQPTVSKHWRQIIIAMQMSRIRLSCVGRKLKHRFCFHEIIKDCMNQSHLYRNRISITSYCK